MRLNLLTDEDVCTMFRVRKSYLRDLRSQKRIPFLKLGNLVRYRAEELESWINSGASARTCGAEVTKALEECESYVHREKKNG
ncbi:MAG: helix-turn-helix domain-containing protein [Pseudomonadota bacterium]